MKKSNNGFRKYKSHKVVEAAQILSMEYPGNLEGFDDNFAIYTTLDKGLIRVSRSWCQRHEPEEGGYIVRYEDGYMSYSPQRAFEKGYSQIEETPLNVSSENLFQKKPITIEAFQYDGDLINSDGEFYVPNWAKEACEKGVLKYHELAGGPPELHVVTKEGLMLVSVNDWIIKGVEGELYPCKPRIFEATYTKI